VTELEEGMNSDGEAVILHISDLHRTPGAELSNTDLWGSLRHDIWHGYAHTNLVLGPTDPKLPTPTEIDLVVVSGDITQRAGAQEYREAEDFLATVADHLLDGDRTRVVIVPGNHDIDWDISRAAYRQVSHPDPAQARFARQEGSRFRTTEGSNPLERILLERTREDLYRLRFKEFADFFDEFYQEQLHYPRADTEGQFTIHETFVPSLGIVVVGFNSCYGVDHLWHRGAIKREDILQASEQLDERGYAIDSPLRVAVWHHNVLGNHDEQDFMDPRTALLLSEHGFALGLHGHVHQSGRLDLLGSHARMPVVWAGSLCAGAPERPPSIPLLYSVIGVNLQRREAWAHVRARRNEREAWTPYHEWGQAHRPWYRVSLGSRDDVLSKETERLAIYRDVADVSFASLVEELIAQSSEITFVGTGLNVLHGHIRDLIIKRARAGQLRATLCFGNPFSEHVRARLIEEERGATRPDLASDGIIRRVAGLLEQSRGIDNVSVRLFNNYPTLAAFRFDDRYIYYSMGYRRLGNLCPVTVVNRRSILSEFLDQTIQSYLADSVDAAEIFRIKVDRARSPDFVHPEDLVEVGIFAIPDEKSDFYLGGALLLGFDVFRPATSPAAHGKVSEEDLRFFRSHIGSAGGYGFHLTIADVMYLHRNQLQTLRRELEAVAAAVMPFDLTVTELSEGLVQRNALALAVVDESGQLEHLEAEVTVRLRPVALGTNYTLDRAVLQLQSRPTIRDRVMMERYQSPNVLNRYRPHFTLALPATAPSSSDRTRLRRIAEHVFRPYLEGEAVSVDSLYLVTRSIGAETWAPISSDGVVKLG